jgi:CYTH domain-containing protein
VVATIGESKAQRSQRLVQGYLTPAGGAPEAAAGGGAAVRSRSHRRRAWLNIKSAIAGIERREYEYAIPLSTPSACSRVLPRRVEKIRHCPVCQRDVRSR